MAEQSLPEKQIQKRMQRHRQAVFARAMQIARNAVNMQAPMAKIDLRPAQLGKAQPLAIHGSPQQQGEIQHGYSDHHQENFCQ